MQIRWCIYAANVNVKITYKYLYSIKIAIFVKQQVLALESPLQKCMGNGGWFQPPFFTK